MTNYFLRAGVVLVSLTGMAAAQTVTMKPDDVIAARQGGMAMVGGIAESMKAAVAAGSEVKPFAEGAAGIEKWAKAYPGMYPDGTQTGHETKAKPEIWSDRAGFEKANAALVAAAEKLGEVAKGGDKAAFKDAFAAMGQTCGTCHRAYKAR